MISIKIASDHNIVHHWGTSIETIAWWLKRLGHSSGHVCYRELPWNNLSFGNQLGVRLTEDRVMKKPEQ